MRARAEREPLVESTEKPVPRIFRCPTKVINESAEDSRKKAQSSGQRRFPGDTSQQTTPESRDKKEPRSTGKNNEVGMLEESLPRFGPMYGADKRSVEATKEEA
ncbi:hypothetical protein Salat_1736700 [Sesamum alatum]|uniref:Uncharacterized protein n=1 Tax=Sesamum alatum TaxID=300844 RepID=A0AAE1Y8R2_9LAMI|nr:hypothetical protein Salat_1736700 [Sesamum alatum]